MTDVDPRQLREIAARQIADGQRLLLLADVLDGGALAPAAPVVPVMESPDTDELISLGDAAILLGIRYDAVRQRAKRAGATVKVHPSSYVWRSWVNAQANVRSVRSCSVQCSPAFQTSRSVR